MRCQDWRPTSNARNEIMVKEARKFSLQLKALHKDLTGLDKAVDSELLDNSNHRWRYFLVRVS